MKRLGPAASSMLVFLLLAGCNSNSSPVATSGGTTGNESQSAESTSEGAPTVAPQPATEPLPGYLLISPLRSTETYLIDQNNQVVHSWSSDYPPCNAAYLLPNGDLLRGARDPDFRHFHGGGIGGILERYNWEGELIWSFQYATEDYCSHHDIEPLPNGNILMTAWERKSREEAVAQGRDPELLEQDLWPDHVIEVQPDGPTGGKIVWEWHMWDHLVQDFDREKPNYGVVYEHPELIDLNNTGSSPPPTAEELRKLRAVGYTGGGGDDGGNRRRGADWLHTNAISYNPELDQIAISAKNFSEIWVIDHSTTTEEAASHRGGRSGKGGDLLYRWGNPWSYKSGTAQDKMLFDQHDVRWIPSGLPGSGHLMAFNNGPGRGYSSIIEIQPPLEESGNYTLDDEGRYGPYELAWEYKAENPKDFFSSFISGATRQPNGNTLICEGASGRVFEVNSEGKTLWEFVSPYGGELTQDGRPNDAEAVARRLVDGNRARSFVENNALFRATKIPLDHPALAGKTLKPLAQQPVPFATLVDQAVERLKAERPDEADTTDAQDTDAQGTEPQDTEPQDAAAQDTDVQNTEAEDTGAEGVEAQATEAQDAAAGAEAGPGATDSAAPEPEAGTPADGADPPEAAGTDNAADAQPAGGAADRAA